MHVKMNDSLKYSQYFNKATDEVLLLKYLYIMNIPLIRFFLFLRVSPMVVTSLSNLAAIVAICALLVSEPLLFGVFWFLNLCLDLCDGTLARITGTSSALGGFYDSVSDQFKIVILLLAIIYLYNDDLLTVLCSIAVVFYMMRLYIIGIYANAKKQQHKLMGNDRNIGSKVINRKGILYFFYSAIFILYGNVMLLFLFVGVDVHWATWSIAIFMVSILFNFFKDIYRTTKVFIYLDKNK